MNMFKESDRVLLLCDLPGVAKVGDCGTVVSTSGSDGQMNCQLKLDDAISHVTISSEFLALEKDTPKFQVNDVVVCVKKYDNCDINAGEIYLVHEIVDSLSQRKPHIRLVNPVTGDHIANGVGMLSERFRPLTPKALEFIRPYISDEQHEAIFAMLHGLPLDHKPTDVEKQPEQEVEEFTYDTLRRVDFDDEVAIDTIEELVLLLKTMPQKSKLIGINYDLHNSSGLFVSWEETVSVELPVDPTGDDV